VVIRSYTTSWDVTPPARASASNTAIQTPLRAQRV